MLRLFLAYLENNNLARPGDRVLVAVSGGVDSVVLAHLFVHGGYNIGIAHCNFKLRGEESDEDEKFVNSLSNDLGCAFHVNHFNTEGFANEYGISIQMAARELRKLWFKKVMKQEGYQLLALAHHKDDQLETILFNLSKGTGIAGLSGMQPKAGNTIRPLLFADREMIGQYAGKENLSWREDSSNITLKYHRNLIRHKVAPVLKEINPGLTDTLDYTLLRMVETEAVLNKSLLDFLNKAVRKEEKDIYISKEKLEGSLSPTLSLYAVLEPLGFNYMQCVNVFESLDKVGNLFYGDGSVLNIDRTDLVISPLEEENFQSLIIEVSEEDRIKVVESGQIKIHVIEGNADIESLRNIALLDFDKLKFPLRIRHWAAGDRFVPLGMKGKKKVSDLMIDEKIPLNLKSRVLILESGEDIIWVIGHRIDDRYKVTSDTRRIWRAEYVKA